MIKSKMRNSFVFVLLCLPRTSQGRIGDEREGYHWGPDDMRSLEEESHFWSNFLHIKSVNKAQPEMSMTSEPTQQPSREADVETNQPTQAPTDSVVATEIPTQNPTLLPSTATPTQNPTLTPSTNAPSPNPTVSPSTQRPSFAPSTNAPSSNPTVSPSTQNPTLAPSTNAPSPDPTVSPSTQRPSFAPSQAPSLSAIPTTVPTIFFLPSGEFINGTLTGNGPQVNGRITRDEVVSSCENGKEFPGRFGNVNREFEVIGPFWNQDPEQVCVVITWDFGTCIDLGDVLVHPSAYTELNPANLTEGYLGDNGSSEIDQFSFLLDGSNTFFMVFQQVIGGTAGINCTFQFRVDFNEQDAASLSFVPNTNGNSGTNHDKLSRGRLGHRFGHG